MNELTTHRFVWLSEIPLDSNIGKLYYLKSDADRCIAHQKRKRCEAKASEWGLIAQILHYNTKCVRRANKYAELAEKFKEMEK